MVHACTTVQWTDGSPKGLTTGSTQFKQSMCRLGMLLSEQASDRRPIPVAWSQAVAQQIDGIKISEVKGCRNDGTV